MRYEVKILVPRGTDDYIDAVEQQIIENTGWYAEQDIAVADEDGREYRAVIILTLAETWESVAAILSYAAAHRLKSWYVREGREV